MKHLIKLIICFLITAILMFFFYHLQGQESKCIEYKVIEHEICIDSIATFSDWDKFKLEMFYLAGRLTKEHEFTISQYTLYDYLMKTVFAECKFKTGTAAINRLSDARGAIQWMPKLRRKLGVPEDVHNMPLSLQVPYIETYFNYKIDRHKIDTKKIKSFVDVYCIVFAPAYADNSKNSILYSRHKNCGAFCWKHKKRKCAYHANKGYDISKDGRIRKAEIESYVLNKHYRKK